MDTMAATIMVKIIQKAYLLNLKNSAIMSGTIMKVRLYLSVINKKNLSNAGFRRWFMNSKRVVSTIGVYYMQPFVSTGS